MDLFQMVDIETNKSGGLPTFRVIDRQVGNGYAYVVAEDDTIRMKIVREHGNFFVDFAPTAQPDHWVTSDILSRALGIAQAPVGQDLSQLLDWIRELLSCNERPLHQLFRRETLPQSEIRLKDAARESVRERFGFELD